MDKVQHFEIPADDVERAKAFYEKSFGWKTANWPMPDGSAYAGLYTGPVDKKNMWKEKGFINGGMFQRNGFFPITTPTVAVVVKNLDATLEKVKAEGGSIVMDKKSIGGMGWYAYIKDTENNIIGVWEDIAQEKPKKKNQKKTKAKSNAKVKVKSMAKSKSKSKKR